MTDSILSLDTCSRKLSELGVKRPLRRGPSLAKAVGRFLYSLFQTASLTGKRRAPQSPARDSKRPAIL
jgi:hypothetical protein